MPEKCIKYNPVPVKRNNFYVDNNSVWNVDIYLDKILSAYLANHTTIQEAVILFDLK